MIWVLLVGLVAGFLAGKVMKGRGFGLVGNIVVGVVGAVIGNALMAFLPIHATGTIGSLFTAFIGAVVLIYCVGLIKKM